MYTNKQLIYSKLFRNIFQNFQYNIVAYQDRVQQKRCGEILKLIYVQIKLILFCRFVAKRHSQQLISYFRH